ncbi:MAG: Hpt domain-containing protein [Flavobacterium sp.]|nr:MAG: Hpt domain-containing protein [Flavobacterium sp.]
MSSETVATFDLETLNQFTQDDPESLKLIVDTFVESSHENCEQLTQAAANSDWNQMASLAHKMIPMLKQMEVFSIVELLEPIEDRKLDLDKDGMVEYTSEICRKMNELFVELRLEIQSR